MIPLNKNNEISLIINQRQKEKNYWMKELSGISYTNIPYDRVDEGYGVNIDTEVIHFKISNEVHQKILKLSKSSEQLIHSVLLAVLFILIRKHHVKKEEILVGTPVYGHDMEEIFINTVLPLVDRDLSENLSFKQLLVNTRESLVRGIENQNFPIEYFYNEILKGNNNHHKLFDIALVLENIQEKQMLSQACNLIFTFHNTCNGLEARIEYNKAFYRNSTVERLARYYNNILTSVMTNIDLLISDISLVSSFEQTEIARYSNNEVVEYPKDKTIDLLFEERVYRSPQAIAIEYLDEKVTYNELNLRVNQLAEVLIRNGIEQESIVAIVMDKSIDMIAAMLAILKCGGAYLPIDPMYPEDRIKFMIEDSHAKASIISNSTKLSRECLFNKVINVDELKLNPLSVSSIKSRSKPSSLAYVIYTSGTTGTPKGVMVEHRNIVSLITTSNLSFNFTQTDVWTMFHSHCFDFSVWEIYGALLFGAKLIIIPKEVSVNPTRFLELLEEKKVTVLNQTPTAFYNLMEEDLKTKKKCLCLKYIIFGGEALTTTKVKAWKDRYDQIKFINMYGITETTVHVTFKEILDDDIQLGISNIGKPIPTAQVYLLDEKLNIVPIGIVGELYIGGEGVTRGYLNRRELTLERFIPSPFTTGERIYKTGDMGKYLENGEIEYISRKDEQVKIRGFRIELKEIEMLLLNHTGIRDVVVVPNKDKGENIYLCAYVVAKNKSIISTLRSYLSELVPDYMIPAFFISIDRFPTTSNGKIDTKALPKPYEQVQTLKEYIPPRDHIETRLLQLLKNVLDINSDIGIEDNFFELGGHSLKAFSLSSRVLNELNVELPISVIFEKPTVKEMAEYVRVSDKKEKQSIKKAEIQEYYPLSSAQKSMFILNEIEKNSIIYNIPCMLMLKGDLCKEKLNKTFKEIINRHEVLRTGFSTIEELPVQKVYEKVDFEIQEYHVGNRDIKEIYREFIRPFNLQVPPLFRIGLIYIDSLTHILMFDIHHIVSDRASMQILIDDFVKVYNNISLPHLVLQYKDYAIWQQNQMERGAFEEQERYWMNLLNGEIPTLRLPTDYKRNDIHTFKGATLTFDIDEELSEKIRNLAKLNNVTLYMFFLAAYYSLLYKYTGQEDIIIGTPTAGRNRSEIEDVLGVFINVLPLRNYLKENKSFRDFLIELKPNVTNAFENQDYPFENLVEKLNINRRLHRNPLFDTMFALQRTIDMDISMGNLKLEICNVGTNTSKFDLMLTVLESDQHLSFEIEYCIDSFNSKTINNLGNAYVYILKRIIENPYVKLGELEIIPEDEKKELLNEFNSTDVYYPKNKMLHQLFEEQVARTPDKVALICNNQKITYRELNEKSNSLARVLRNNGVTKQKVVAIAVERSVEMVIGILAILKAGGAFLPIDINLPDNRVQFMLEECHVEWVLVNTQFNTFGRKRIDIQEEPARNICCVENLENENNLDDLAYIIYTSGSTGVPKGVMIEHRSVLNFFKGITDQIEFNEKGTIISLTTISFDIFIVETLLPLTKGMKVVIADKDTLEDIGKLTEEIIVNNVDVMQVTPSTMSLYIKETTDLTFLKGLKTIMIGGDVFPQNLLEELRKHSKAVIYNMYGPTETTIWSSVKRVSSDNKLSIGYPIANTKIYILDRKNQLVPMGVVGELCIGGDGLSRGYVNREELTKTRFINNPYKNGEKIYKTGDLARRLPNGEIEYIGRIDSQIKLRGYRIELEEIEEILNKYSTDLHSVVTVKEWNDSKYICAYLESSTVYKSNDIKKYLLKYLPAYMIPSYFVFIKNIPLSKNGKVDRNALPMPLVIEPDEENYSPSNDVEKKLMDLWKDILLIDTVSIHDDFFELGGHSLRAIALVNRIHKEMGVQIKLLDLFSNSTLKELSDFIIYSNKTDFREIPTVVDSEFYPLSSPQRRMFILNQLDKNNTAYNMVMTLQLKGRIDKQKIESTFNKLMKRHEILRTRFEFIKGQPVQIVEKQMDLKITCIEIKEEELVSTLQRIRKPFDLSKAPLIRVTLIEVNKEKILLVVDMHHILSDGISAQIIMDEFTKVYNDEKLMDLPIQYKDYAVWQQELIATLEYKKQEEYWLNEFNDVPPELNLSTDYIRQSFRSYAGEEVAAQLNLEILNHLNNIATNKKTTIYNILFSAYSILLHKYTNQEDICIGSTLTGRNHAGLQSMIGVFVNTLPVRSYPVEDKCYFDFLNEISYKTLEILTNQDYQFDDLVKKLGLQGNIGKNPIFDVAFTFHNLNMKAIKIENLEIVPFKKEHKTSQFDLQLIINESEESLDVIFEYDSDLFEKESIIEMKKNYLKILEQIMENPERKIKEFHIERSAHEKLELNFHEYNTFDF